MSTRLKILFACAGITIVAVFAFFTVCPCGPTPGGYLFGAVQDDPVADWTFVNEEPLCQLEVRTWRPHSINLNCMSDEGRLYVSCSNCAGKYWSAVALENGMGRIRIGKEVFPVALIRVVEPSELDRAWAARLAKLGRSTIPRPEHWWSFRLASLVQAR